MASEMAAPPCATEVVSLDARSALDSTLVGRKAANLARARRHRLPVLDGFVLPAPLATEVAWSGILPPEVIAAYDALSEGGTWPVVVRSSSGVEDGETSSLAGRFTSVVGVADQRGLVAAVADVVASGAGEPMAVLVQPHVDPLISGVLFGVDPVSGRNDRLTVAAVAGGPQLLVSGSVSGDHYVLARHGRIVDHDRGDAGAELLRADRRALVRLAARTARRFGAPQDIEWARTPDGRTILLQSRPVTATARPAIGPRYGPGPLAETFPHPLSRLEEEMWIPPLREAIGEVLVLTGRASRRQLQRRAVVVCPGGRPAVDLELGAGSRRRRFPGPAWLAARWHRLRLAWRIGRLTAAVPALAAQAVADADAALAEVPSLGSLTDSELLTVLGSARDALRSLHGLELLAGALTADDTESTAAQAALSALGDARRLGLSDDDVVARHPEVLALSPPAVGPPAALPGSVPAVRRVALDQLGAREALRLRARWVHQLTASAAHELGRRLAARAILETPLDVRHLRLDDLGAAIAGREVALAPNVAGPPLPAEFRLDVDGGVVPEPVAGGERGIGAGGGRRVGPVHVGDRPPPGSVLVTSVLDPALAVHLPLLAGVVAETGSPLSHLAILAREHGVATVVGYPQATTRWPPGEVVLVDGTIGVVRPLEGGS